MADSTAVYSIGDLHEVDTYFVGKYVKTIVRIKMEFDKDIHIPIMVSFS